MVNFLSCLYGSEPVLALSANICLFLSCLYGSELGIVPAVLNTTFLSCLYGSEQRHGFALAVQAISELPIRQ